MAAKARQINIDEVSPESEDDGTDGGKTENKQKKKHETIERVDEEKVEIIQRKEKKTNVDHKTAGFHTEAEDDSTGKEQTEIEVEGLIDLVGLETTGDSTDVEKLDNVQEKKKKTNVSHKMTGRHTDAEASTDKEQTEIEVESSEKSADAEKAENFGNPPVDLLIKVMESFQWTTDRKTAYNMCVELLGDLVKQKIDMDFRTRSNDKSSDKDKAENGEAKKTQANVNHKKAGLHAGLEDNSTDEKQAEKESAEKKRAEMKRAEWKKMKKKPNRRKRKAAAAAVQGKKHKNECIESLEKRLRSAKTQLIRDKRLLRGMACDPNEYLIRRRQQSADACQRGVNRLEDLLRKAQAQIPKKTWNAGRGKPCMREPREAAGGATASLRVAHPSDQTPSPSVSGVPRQLTQPVLSRLPRQPLQHLPLQQDPPQQLPRQVQHKSTSTMDEPPGDWPSLPGHGEDSANKQHLINWVLSVPEPSGQMQSRTPERAKGVEKNPFYDPFHEKS